MKVLVTGGAGFIGSHIVDSLIKKNNVVVIDNLYSGKEENINEKAKLVKVDINDNLDEVFDKEKFEIVIHAAAQVKLRDSFEDPVFDAKTNVLGTINVLEACRKFKVRKVIYISTGGARVGEPEYLPVDENHPLNPSSPYGISKHSGEHYFKMYYDLYNLDYIAFCFGNVYGPRDDPKCKRVMAMFITSILEGDSPKIFGSGDNTRDYIYVKDLAEFVVESIDKKPEHKLFHLANGEQKSVNELFKILKDISGFEKDAEHIEAVKGEVKDCVLDTTLAKKELNWEVKHSFEEGIKETFEWFKTKGKSFKG